MFKRILAIILALTIPLCFTACDKKYTEKDLYEYKAQEFEISALSGPYEMSEQAFIQYKNAGFNVLAFSIHNGLYDSDNLFYLGSNRTLKALELCKKVGLDAYVAYGNSWIVQDFEGEDYFGDTPFSKHNYYGEYMDIIKGIRIMDEPSKEKLETLSDDVLINDFKKVYVDKKYMINLLPFFTNMGAGFASYNEMLKIFGETILSKFEEPYISVDVYPYSNKDVDDFIVYNYNEIAKCAKKYGAETTMILQSSTGCEFLPELSEGDIRQQAYLAIAFGADNLQYYCYAVPKEIEYNYCILNPDGTPSKIYNCVKEVNGEVQKIASAVLAYDWEESIGISGTEQQTFRVGSIEFDENFDPRSFKDAKNYASATGAHDLVVSQFKSVEYGEAYMFVNFSETVDENNTVKATFKDCGAVAIYGGEDYSGTPEIVTLDEDGNFEFELAYGEGVFVTPLTK